MLTVLILLATLGAEAAPSRSAEKTLKIDCQGFGPSRTIARAEALDECRKMAVHQLQSNFTRRSLTIQTESDAALHEEVLSDLTVENLNCQPQNEHEEDVKDSVKVTLTCLYDLQNTVIKTKEIHTPSLSTPQSIDIRKSHAERGKTYAGQKRNLSVTVIPPCSSILIEGSTTRIIRCRTNPTTMVLDETDEKLIIRADGFKPKEIKKSELGAKYEIQVILNP